MPFDARFLHRFDSDGLCPAFGLHGDALTILRHDQISAIVAAPAGVLDAVVEPTKQGRQEDLECCPIHLIYLSDARAAEAAQPVETPRQLAGTGEHDEQPKRPEDRETVE